MQRIKPKKKQKSKDERISKHFIMSVILPCVVLAAKDTFEEITERALTQDELDQMSIRANRYLGYVENGSVSLVELHGLMSVKDTSEGEKK